MNKQLLTIGIVLSLGTVGCAGLGVQHGSSLTAQVQAEQGVDGLWFSAERPPTQGLKTPRYAGQGVGDLWGTGEANAGLSQGIEVETQRGLGELWNTAAVTRSWEVEDKTALSRRSKRLLSDSSRSRSH